MTLVLVASAALAVGGAAAAAGAVLVVSALLFLRRRPRPVPFRPVLVLVLVELRTGHSALGALQRAASALPEQGSLGRAARLASLKGIGAAVSDTDGDVRRLLTQMARAQRSGAPLADTVRSLLEAEIAEDRSRRIEKARSLPVRLMIPTALLLLPGLVLMLYAPSLLRSLGELAGSFT